MKQYKLTPSGVAVYSINDGMVTFFHPTAILRAICWAQDHRLPNLFRYLEQNI
jgi:hypothetical protein